MAKRKATPNGVAFFLAGVNLIDIANKYCFCYN
jgi:hypothetical protein